MHVLEPDAGGLRHELALVWGGEVAACDVRSDLSRNVRGQRGDIPGRRAVDFGRRRKEGALLVLQLVRLPLDRLGESLVHHAADRAARAEHDQAGELQQEISLSGVELGDEEGQHDCPGPGRHGEAPPAVHDSGGERDQAGQEGERGRPADPPAGVQRRADEDQRRRGREKADPKPPNRPN